MKIEKLSENKIRIIFNKNDLKEKNIDFHSFMSNPIESQDLFFDMLNTAEKEIGFKTKDYKLAIEAIAIADGTFILTVTRTLPEKSIPKKVSIKRKNTLPSSALSIYSFNTFEDFCDFCTYFNNTNLSTLLKKMKKISLYYYNDTYYLVFYTSNILLKDFKKLHYIITEFGLYENNPELFEKKLLEYGKLIIKNNAINKCITYFSL